MKTNEELMNITAEGISETLTIPELTTIYNFNSGGNQQVKKFRTKEQAIERCLKALATNQVVVSQTADPIDQQTEGYIRVIRGDQDEQPEQLQNIAQEPDADKPDLMLVDGVVHETIAVHTNAESTDLPDLGYQNLCKLLAPKTYGATPTQPVEITEQLPSTAVDPGLAPATITITTEQKPRRRAVKGVAKIAMDLLRHGLEGENIISVVQQKYINEGGYSEKDARANAQNILAYVKEKMQKESQTEANAQMDAASSAA